MKKNYTHVFALLAVFVLFNSCNPVLRKIYGIKNPDIENERTILKKAKKYKLDTADILTVTAADFLKVLSGRGIPDAAVYDGQGRYIEYRVSDSACNAGLFTFIAELDTAKLYHRPDSLGLDQEMVKFRDVRGRPVVRQGGADFYVLIYWTIWTGRLNKNHVKIWKDLAKNNSRCSIQVILVNLDIQQYWDEPERTRIVSAMSKKKK
jgi:hypothetical protein